MRSRKLDPDLAIVDEMQSYIEEHNSSYYELAAYAYENDLYEWLRMLRSQRYGRHFHLICKRQHYNISAAEAKHKYEAAQALFYQRHTTQYGTWDF